MTEQEQRIAIAEACGWKFVRDEGGPYHHSGFHMCRPGSDTPCGFKPDSVTWKSTCCVFHIPDYLNDLNAMHEVEKTLDESQRTKFYWELAKIVLGDNVPLNCTFLLVHATAAQRAKAFLRTLGKWSSSPLRESE
jgi:hypothetical protein